MLNNLPLFYVDDLIKRALNEDINYIDLSSSYIFSDGDSSYSYFISKDDGVLSGVDVSLRVFSLLDDNFRYETKYHDGDSVKNGDILAAFKGKTSRLLAGERTALNILQHMSGIATMTARAVDAIKGTSSCISDTRKTLPGLRPLEKYAVTCGGGKNHRYNLSDAVMLKDNHIDALGGIAETVLRVKKSVGHTVKIEVETRNLSEVREALFARVDIIMFDNMSLEDMKKGVELVNKKAVTEASGNITLENVKEVAETGVDIISMGVLTHSAPAFDISMKFKK